MRGTWVAIGAVGLVAVAVAAFLAGRGCGSTPQVRLPTPETGGPVPTAPGKRPAGKAAVTVSAKGERPPTGKAMGKARPAPGAKSIRRPRRQPEPERVEAQAYRNAKLHLAIEKPRSTDWVMTDKKASFLIPRPHKVLEIRRLPRDGSGRFAQIELVVADIPPGKTADEVADEIEKHKGITKWAQSGKFTLLDERTVTIGGRSMIRRVVRVDFEGRERRILTLRATRRGKLYMVIGRADPKYFDELMPEFDQALNSLRID